MRHLAELGIRDLAIVRQIVDRVYVLYRANLVEAGPIDQVLDAPRHGYTRRLIGSIPGHARAPISEETR